MTRLYLADKSALEQRRHSNDARDLLALLLAENALASCHLVALEVLFSARNRKDYETLKVDIEKRWLAVDLEVMDRAMEVQHLLAKRGQHRLPLPDLIIAAAAEVHGATVLHYDHDYDLIGAVTDQPTQWIVPMGTGG